MSWIGGLFRGLGGEERVSAEPLTAYRRVGGQVLDVYERLQAANGRARAYGYAARTLQGFADKLVEDAFADEGQPGSLPRYTALQAEAVYRQIPELVTAAKQEAIDPRGRRDISLPVFLRGRVEMGGRMCPAGHLRALQRATNWAYDMVEAEIETASGERKGARLYLAEAGTNRDSGNYMVTGMEKGVVKEASFFQTETYFWQTLGYLMAAMQELAVPGVLQGVDVEKYLEGPGEDDEEGRPRLGNGGALGDLGKSIGDFLQALTEESPRQEWNELRQREGHHHKKHHEHHWRDGDWD